MDGETYYLIANRGASYEYIDMFNPRCPIEKVVTYVRLCPKYERDRLRKYIDKFDVLYYDSFEGFLEYNVMYDRYEKIKPYIIEGLSLPPISNACNLHGFPKGRKKNGETGIEAALREFEEEIGITRNYIRILKKPTVEEKYIGSDGKSYRNVYYMCDSPYMLIPRTIRSKSIFLDRQYVVSSEIQHIDWATKEQAKNILPPSTFETIRF